VGCTYPLVVCIIFSLLVCHELCSIRTVLILALSLRRLRRRLHLVAAAAAGARGGYSRDLRQTLWEFMRPCVCGVEKVVSCAGVARRLGEGLFVMRGERARGSALVRGRDLAYSRCPQFEVTHLLVDSMYLRAQTHPRTLLFSLLVIDDRFHDAQ